MKRLKTLATIILGGILMTITTGCALKMSEEEKVKAELAPLYKVLDNQSLEGYDVLSVMDSIDIYGTGSTAGYQVDLEKNESGELVGKGYDFSISETEGFEASYTDGQIKVNTDIPELKDFQFIFDDFHFSEKYFNGLNEIKVLDHPETYMKIVRYEEMVPSSYTKKLIDAFGLEGAKPAVIDVEKGLYEENLYRYILTYTLKDEADIWIERTFVFVMGETE